MNHAHLAAGAFQSVCMKETSAAVSSLERVKTNKLGHLGVACNVRETAQRTCHTADGIGAGAGQQAVAGAVISAGYGRCCSASSIPLHKC